jgi:hypothetical protein
MTRMSFTEVSISATTLSDILKQLESIQFILDNDAYDNQVLKELEEVIISLRYERGDNV